MATEKDAASLVGHECQETEPLIEVIDVEDCFLLAQNRVNVCN